MVTGNDELDSVLPDTLLAAADLEGVGLDVPTLLRRAARLLRKRDFEQRLLEKCREIISDLERGELQVDVDEEFQHAIAERFNLAFVQLMLAAQREDQDALVAAVAARREDKR